MGQIFATLSIKYSTDAAADVEQASDLGVVAPALSRAFCRAGCWFQVYQARLIKPGLIHGGSATWLPDMPVTARCMCGTPGSILSRLLRWLTGQIFAMLSTKYSTHAAADAAADAAQVGCTVSPPCLLFAAGKAVVKLF
jgi:hypothetical protein